MRFTYYPVATCSTVIDFDMDEQGIVTNISYTNGCNGNLKAISCLVDGMSYQQIIDKCRGIVCGGKGTSCADQLSKAVELAWDKMSRNQPPSASSKPGQTISRTPGSHQ